MLCCASQQNGAQNGAVVRVEQGQDAIGEDAGDEEFDGRTRTEIMRDADDIAGALSDADRHVAVTAGTPLASPAFLLVAACCRWPPSQSRNAAVQAAAAPFADWNAVVVTARRQRVAGLLYEALLAAGVQLPLAPAAEFARRAQAIFRKNLLLAAETCRLQKLLDAAEIPSVALKGVALAQLAYGSLKVKDTHDIDLLVPPDRAVAAMALLERDGYALSFPSSQLSATQRRAVVRYSREVAFIHRDSRVFTELQWRIESAARTAAAMRRRRQCAGGGAQFSDTILARARMGVLCRPVPHRFNRHYRRYFLAAAALSAFPLSAVAAAVVAVAARRRLPAARAEPLAPVLWSFHKRRRRQRINHWPSVIYLALS
jgi:hypothetical protein